MVTALRSLQAADYFARCMMPESNIDISSSMASPYAAGARQYADGGSGAD